MVKRPPAMNTSRRFAEITPKTVVFGDTNARCYDRRHALAGDRLAALKGDQAAGR